MFFVFTRVSLLLCPGRGAEYCNQCVRLSVCEHICGAAGPIFTKFFVQIPCCCGSVLLWQRCDMLCTSRFIDDVTFICNGPYEENGAESDVYECLVCVGVRLFVFSVFSLS